MSADLAARRFRVAGQVQGVGFRYFAAQTARRLGLTGFVCNRADGTVEVEASGQREALDGLAVALRSGPSHARVTAVETVELPPGPGVTGFEIRD